MTASAIAAYQDAQKALVKALQDEFLADDLELPPSAYGWTSEEMETFYASGGTTLPDAAAAVAPPPDISAAVDAPKAASEEDPLRIILKESGYAHLSEVMASISWDEVRAMNNEGRPKLLARLGELGIKLADRQKLATAFSKATKPGGALYQLPGGTRQQPSEPFLVTAIDAPGKPKEELVQDVEAYQACILSAGIPKRSNGLFPANDPYLTLLTSTLSPCTKALTCPTRDGGFAFATVESGGWAVGESSIGHGLDLRWFIEPGFDSKAGDLTAAVRFSQYAEIGRGHGIGIHGGAIETCLDESTAECAKSKLFPMATTSDISFKIQKPVMANTTYRVYCKVVKERLKGIAYEVSGEITDTEKPEIKFATCTCTMVNAPLILAQKKA